MSMTKRYTVHTNNTFLPVQYDIWDNVANTIPVGGIASVKRARALAARYNRENV